MDQAGNGDATATGLLCVTGATGTLGHAFARVADERSIPYHLLRRQEMDIADPASVAMTLDALRPWAVVNTAGYVRVDDAERAPGRCRRENAEGPAVLAAACAERGVRLVTFSSDLVFDGRKGTPYVESDAVAPLGVYGRSKAEAEHRVLERLPGALVVRASAFFGPWDEHNFVHHALRALDAGEPFVAADDLVVSPTYVPDLVSTSLGLLTAGAAGLWHVANPAAVTWAQLARGAGVAAGVDPAGVVGRPWRELGWVAPRPAYGVLGSERGVALPPLRDALARYVRERPRQATGA